MMELAAKLISLVCWEEVIACSSIEGLVYTSFTYEKYFHEELPCILHVDVDESTSWK